MANANRTIDKAKMRVWMLAYGWTLTGIERLVANADNMQMIMPWVYFVSVNVITSLHIWTCSISVIKQYKKVKRLTWTSFIDLMKLYFWNVRKVKQGYRVCWYSFTFQCLTIPFLIHRNFLRMQSYISRLSCLLGIIWDSLTLIHIIFWQGKVFSI